MSLMLNTTQFAEGIDIVERAKRGDEPAFQQIYRAHAARIHSLCRRILRNEEDAEDLTQEVFLQLFRKIDTYRGEAAFSTWLHRLSLNIILMALRKRHLNVVPLEEEGAEDHASTVPELGRADQSLIGCVDRVALERAVSELPPGYRIMYLLHDVEGYEHEEIADILGCTAGNCKSQVHKARMKLRRLLRTDAGVRRERRQDHASND